MLGFGFCRLFYLLEGQSIEFQFGLLGFCFGFFFIFGVFVRTGSESFLISFVGLVLCFFQLLSRGFAFCFGGVLFFRVCVIESYGLIVKFVFMEGLQVWIQLVGGIVLESIMWFQVFLVQGRVDSKVFSLVFLFVFCFVELVIS